MEREGGEGPFVAGEWNNSGRTWNEREGSNLHRKIIRARGKRREREGMGGKKGAKVKGKTETDGSIAAVSIGVSLLTLM